MNARHLAFIVFRRRFPTEACLTCIALPQLPPARAAAATPVTPLLPRTPVGIGICVEGFHVLGLEILIRISVVIFYIYTFVRMNTSDLAGKVLPRRLPAEPRLTLISLTELPPSRAAAPRARPRPAPRPAALPYVFGLHALLALAVIHFEVVGVVSHAADLGLGPLALARQSCLDLVALSELRGAPAAAARALPVGVGPGIYSFHVLLLEPRVAVAVLIPVRTSTTERGSPGNASMAWASLDFHTVTRFTSTVPSE